MEQSERNYQVYVYKVLVFLYFIQFDTISSKGWVGTFTTVNEMYPSVNASGHFLAKMV